MVDYIDAEPKIKNTKKNSESNFKINNKILLNYLEK